MLRKLRRKFIFISTSSFVIVLVVLVAVINIINFNYVTHTQDQLLHALAQHRDAAPAVFSREGAPAAAGLKDMSPELEFTTRFFTVHYDDQGNLTEISLDYIASITYEIAVEYGNTVLKYEKKTGYCGDYRYLIVPEDNGNTVYFLNSSKELLLIRRVLVISIVVALLALFSVFILIFLFSKRAISPFVNNLKKQKQFITDSSHEIKTPLTSISTSADILAMELGDNEWVDNISKQSLRLTKLVENLTALSRLDEIKPMPSSADFLISEVIWEAVEPFTSRMKAAGKHYEQDIEDNLIYHGDSNAIHQMISLLLDNAVKYSDEQGTIRLSVFRKRKKIIIEVFNTSNSIIPKDLDKLFERFYRSDTSRSRATGGAGVGLSIVKATVEAHKGQIRATCPDGNSLSIKIIL